ANVGHLAPTHLFNFCFDQAVVNTAFIPFRARNGDFPAAVEHVGGIGATNHGRNAEFTRNNCRVASATTTIGDDGRSQLHDGLPVRVGHVGDEDIARLDLVHFGRISHDADLAGTDFLANGPPGNEYFAGGLKAVALLDFVAALLGLHGFRTRLEDVNLAINTVTATLDVHA